MTSEVTACGGEQAAAYAEADAQPVTASSPRYPGGRVQHHRRRVHRGVDHADAPGTTRRGPPLSEARGRRRECSEDAVADQALRRPVGDRTSEQVQERGTLPGAKGKVGQQWVEGVAEPTAAEGVVQPPVTDDPPGCRAHVVGWTVQALVLLQPANKIDEYGGRSTLRRRLAAGGHRGGERVRARRGSPRRGALGNHA